MQSASLQAVYRNYLLPLIGVRYALGVAILLVPALLLSAFAAGPGELPGDLAVMQFIQDRIPDQFAWVFEAVNSIGSTAGSIAISLGITALLALTKRYDLALIVFATLPLRLVNVVLKLIIDSPRPPAELVRVTENVDGLGFPSGHTMGSTLLYGVLFILATYHVASRPLRLAIQTVCALMVALAGISRVYVGVHWPSDALGGYLEGAILIIVIFMGVSRFRQPPPPGQAEEAT